MKNMFIKVLSVVMALTMIMGAFGTIALAADAACDHEWVKGDTEAPTCKAPGYTTYKCSKCQEVQLKDIVPSTGEEHVLVDAPAVAATCTTPAKSAGKVCELCDADFRETNGVALGHAYGPVEWTEPTCNTVGQVFKTCGACGDKLVLQTINANPDSNAAGVTCHVGDHNYVYIFEELPSCTEGTLLYMCTYCNNIKAEVVGVGLSHDFDWDDDGNDDVVTVDSTCTATGTHTKTCETCGFKDVETIAEKGHDYDRNNDGVVDASDYVGTPATCTTAGTLTRKCEVCDFEDNSGIDNAIIPHTMVALTQVCDCVLERNNDADTTNDVLKLNQAATCYEAGYQWYHCSVCDFIGNKAGTQGNAEVIPQSEAHKWNANLITKTMTSGTDCPATVAKYRKCDDCGVEELVEWVEEGHEWYTQAEWKAAHPTYTIVGANTDTYYKVVGADSCVTATQYFKICKVCGIEKLDDSKTVDAVPHTWEAQDKWQYVPYTGNLKPCEAGAANYYIRECTECDAEENVLYFTAPHTMNAFSCDAGCTAGQCNNCEHTGRKLVCSVCLGNATTTITTHTPVKGAEKTPAYCNQAAYYYYTCSNDGCTYGDANEWSMTADNVLNPDRHNPATFTPTDGHINPATCTNPGTTNGICTGCGSKDATNKVINVIPATGHTEVAIDPNAPDSTCTATGLTKGVKCSVCDTIITAQEEIPMKDHTPENVPGYPATCSTVGLTDGKRCHDCGTTLEAQVEIPALVSTDAAWNTAAAHQGTNNVVYSVAATCQHGTLNQTQFSGCGHTAWIEGETLDVTNHNKLLPVDTDGDQKVDSTTSETYLKTVALVPANCTTTGMLGYTVCTACDVITAVDDTNCNCAYDQCGSTHADAKALAQHRDTNGDIISYTLTAKQNELVIAAYGHNHVLTVAKVLETCTTDGHEAFWRCNHTGCDQSETLDDGSVVGHLSTETGKNGAKIDKHTAADLYTKTDVATTCTTDGSVAGTYCDKCRAHELNDANYACDGCNSDERDWFVATNGHQISLDDSFGKTCTTAGFDVYKCENCDATSVVTEFRCEDYGTDNHKCSADKCTADVVQGEKVNGKYVNKDTLVWYFDNYEAAGHYFKTDVDGDGKFEVVLSDKEADCYAPASKIQTCVDCGYVEVVSTTGEALGHTSELGCEAGTACTRCQNTVEHNFTTIISNDPNFEGYDCSKDTVITNWCRDCDTTVVVDTINAPGHVYKGTVSYTEPTDLANGVWVWTCGTCHMDIETEITMTRNVTLDLSVVPYIEGMNSANLTAVNGGLVEVTVSITLGETIVGGVDYQLNYDANKFAFEGATFVYNEFLRDGEFVDLTSDEMKEKFKVDVKDNGDNVSVSAYFVADTANMSGNNTALVKFVFRVAPTAIEIDKNDFTTEVSEFLLHDASGINNVYANKISEDIDLELMGDVNFDNAYNGLDMAYVWSIVVGAEGFEYTNVADVDNDGEITLDDYAYIANFANSNQTVADYYDMFNYDIVDILNGFAFADYSGDGNINEIDKNLIKNALEGVNANADAAWTATLAVGYYEKLLADLADGLLATNP